MNSMHLLIAILILAGSLLLTLYSYVNRLYTEKGRFLIRGSKDNVDFFEEHIEPKLGVGPEKAELTFPLLIQGDLILLALLVASWGLGQPWGWETALQAAVFLLLDVLLFAQVLPNVLLTRTAGEWLRSGAGILRASILLVSPLVSISQFLHHVATLAKQEVAESAEPTPSEHIEALMQAGEEEGLLEQGDRKLIQSVVEFGSKTVREVMTPRPEIFAVSGDTPLEELKRRLTTRRFSRVLVYEGDLDHIIGFVHSLDVALPSASEPVRKSVRELLRPIPFVPETKLVCELLKEIQQKAPIAIVVDEYGMVAGVVTVEDMVEEIVGEIRDEHEVLDVIPQGPGAFSVPGSMDLDRLQELFGVRIEETAGATTVSGLVTNRMGRVPGPGEVYPCDGLEFRVLDSNGRRVLRFVITGPTEKPSGSLDAASDTSSPGSDSRSE